MLYKFIILAIMFTVLSCSKQKDPSDITNDDIVLKDIKDVTYGYNTDSGGKMTPLLLDIYFPNNATTNNKYPLFVMIHGGGYLGGDKKGAEDVCPIMADSGFIAASINYRLGWDKGTKGCMGDTASLMRAVYRGLQDGNAALRFLMSKAKNFAIDENWVFIGGASAGSNLAFNTTYLTQEIIQKTNPNLILTLGNVNNAGNNATNSFTIKGVCNMWGGITDSTFINEMNAVPTISFHGMKDGVVPYDKGTYLNCPNYPPLYGTMTVHRQLLRFNTPSVVHLSIEGNHGPDEFSTSFLMSNTACFFKKIIQGKSINSMILTGLNSSCK